MKRIVRKTQQFAATCQEAQAAGGAVRVRFDDDRVGVVLPEDHDGVLETCPDDDVPLDPNTPTEAATRAWLSLDDTSRKPDSEGSLVLAVMFVWPQLHQPKVVDQQQELLRHVLARHRASGVVRLTMARLTMTQASWAAAKRDALMSLGTHRDTKSYVTALLTCDRGYIYDASMAYFFAPYRLRRSQATIIREERHALVNVARSRDANPMRRHETMVRLASPESILNEVA